MLPRAIRESLTRDLNFGIRQISTPLLHDLCRRGSRDVAATIIAEQLIDWLEQAGWKVERAQGTVRRHSS